MGACRAGSWPPILLLLWAGLCLYSSSAIREEESGDPYAMYDGKYVVKLMACNQEAVTITMEAINDTDCEFLSEEGILQLPEKGCGEEWVICSAEVGDKLVAEYGAEIEDKDAGRYFRDSGGTVQGWDVDGVHAQSEFYTAYRNLAAIEAKLKDIVDNSDGIATLEELSPQTHEGRTIKAIRIRDKQWTSGRPRAVFTFQQHAREWVAGMTGVYTAEFLINALKQEPDFVQGMEVVLVPMSNPDGFQFSTTSDRMWRKNRRNNNRPNCRGRSGAGVDLNRNWAKDWGGRGSTSKDVCQDVYIGPSSMSEPETKALAKLIEEAPVTVHIDVHCFSELIMGPWGYTKTRHPNKPKFDELGLAMQTAIKEVHSHTYKYGTGGEVIYLASGTFPDWVGERWPKAAGYCYELRPKANARRQGFSPPANQILPSAEEAIQGLYTALDWAKDQGAPLPPPTAAPTPKPPSPSSRRRSSRSGGPDDPKPPSPSSRRRSSRSGGRRRRRGTRRGRRRSGGAKPTRRRTPRRRAAPKPTTPAPTARRRSNGAKPTRRRTERRRAAPKPTTPAPTERPSPPPEVRRRRSRRRAPPPSATWQCSVCSHVYNPPADGGGKPFEDLPPSWRCPVCGQPKSAYRKA